MAAIAVSPQVLHGHFGVTACILHCTVMSRHCLNLINFSWGVYFKVLLFMWISHFQCAVARLKGVETFVDMQNASVYILYVSCKVMR